MLLLVPQQNVLVNKQKNKEQFPGASAQLLEKEYTSMRRLGDDPLTVATSPVFSVWLSSQDNIIDGNITIQSLVCTEIRGCVSTHLG